MKYQFNAVIDLSIGNVIHLIDRSFLITGVHLDVIKVVDDRTSEERTLSPAKLLTKAFRIERQDRDPILRSTIFPK